MRSINPALMSTSLIIGLKESIGNLSCIAVKLLASRDEGKSVTDLLDCPVTEKMQ